MPSMLRRLLIGEPLPTQQQAQERLSNFAALAVFASDGVSSVAYATEEILLMLALAGSAGMLFSMPVAIAIATLIAIVATSYRQVVYAYPSGGGSYAVARENLGIIPGQITGAALFVDYVLTVSVSTASGIAAVTSAVPTLFEHRVVLCVIAIAFVTVANLRGVRESARVFMFPTYGFMFFLYAMVVAGLYRHFTGAGPAETLPAQSDVTQVYQNASLFLVLRAFSSGCAALTGIECVSNGVQAFREPVSKNASQVLSRLALILGSLFLGITFLSRTFHVMPIHEETVVSQIARASFGHGFFYYGVQMFTAVILILGANTSFNGFPRLARVQALDGFLPRQFANLGDRLVYSNGIIALGVLSSALIVVFRGETHRLIPLYAVGVFLSFTLSQAGLVRHWFKARDEEPRWKSRAFINGLGALVTGVVVVVIAVTKFVHGAWIVVILIPMFVGVFLSIRRHYDAVAQKLSLQGIEPPTDGNNLVLVLVGSVHRGVLGAIRYARSIAKTPESVRAIHIETEANRPRAEFVTRWERYGLGLPLVVLKSPYRNLVEPLMSYIDEALEKEGFDSVTLVLPEFVVGKWYENLLHNQTALWLQVALRNRPNVVIANYRYYL
ncbi:MAG: APC family permease [Armatimonadia bacterium]